MNAQSGTESASTDVTIGLMNGEKLKGGLISFMPMLSRLCLESSPKRKGGARELDTSDIAYIGFHRSSDSPKQPPTLAGMENIKVRTVTNEGFTVLVPGSLSHPSGFHAFAADAKFPYERMFFYDRGVVSKEKPLLIGDMLQEDRLASAAEITQALTIQKKSRKKPLGQILVDNDTISELDLTQALEEQKKKPRYLGQTLLDAGMIRQKDLDLALAEQRQQQGRKLGEILVGEGIISEEAMASALAIKFHMPFINLDEYPVNPAAMSEIDADVIRTFNWLPIATDEMTLTGAICDPLNLEASEAVRFKTRKRVIELLATPTQLKGHIERALTA